MRLDEIDFEATIQQYGENFKRILRKSRKQAWEECKAWEKARQTNPNLLHPLEKRLNIRIPSLHVPN